MSKLNKLRLTGSRGSIKIYKDKEGTLWGNFCNLDGCETIGCLCGIVINDKDFSALQKASLMEEREFFRLIKDIGEVLESEEVR